MAGVAVLALGALLAASGCKTSSQWQFARQGKSGKITTLAGLSQNGTPHKVQAAFIEEQVPQCGYCMNGWVMTTVALLDKTPKPTDAQIEEALTGLKCRCATHVSIMRAVKRAAQA